MSGSAGWEAVIGLEVHVQLKTRTKMFCRCEAAWGAPENTRTCPVCLAHPGSLPVPNGRAVEWTIKLGLALGCEIAQRALFHRKNYFYPDNPKGYQISQYDLPLCTSGRFLVPGEEGETEIGVIRAHLEEDAAKTVHVGGGTGRKVGAEYSLIDFNRGGTPLVEIVSAPDIRSADEAKRFLELLRQTIVELGISDAEMEKGSLRCDANVSVRRPGEPYRTRTELKNMNSFRFVARGIEAEIARQIAVYEAGGEVEQETYDYDAATDTLTPHRSKEEADDYRYFPEPDLVAIEPDRALVERLRAEVPELPGARIRRLEPAAGFDSALGLVSSGRAGAYEALLAEDVPPREAANWLMNDFAATGEDAARINVAEMAKVLKTPGLTREARREATAASVTEGFSALAYTGQVAISDASELDPVIEGVIAANEPQVAQFRAGKEGILGFLVGQVMRETQGKANPKVVNERLREKLKA